MKFAKIFLKICISLAAVNLVWAGTNDANPGHAFIDQQDDNSLKLEIEGNKYRIENYSSEPDGEITFFKFSDEMAEKVFADLKDKYQTDSPERIRNAISGTIITGNGITCAEHRLQDGLSRSCTFEMDVEGNTRELAVTPPQLGIGSPRSGAGVSNLGPSR